MKRDIAFEKGLPAALDYEKLILGAILSGGANYQLASGVLAPEDFTTERHRRIFLRAGELYAAGSPLTVHSVGLALRDLGELEPDGVSYLIGLTDGVPALTDPSVDHYCSVIKDKSALRRVILIGHRLQQRCYDGGESPTAIIASESEALRGVEECKAIKPTLLSFSDVLEAHGGLNAYGQSGQPGIETPWPSLNRIIGGFQPGQMITIAGLTGVGKSAAALQIGMHAAARGIGVALFSLEMSAKEILDRAACGSAAIDSKKLERGALSDAERYRFQQAMAELVEQPLWISDSSACTLPAIHLALRKHIHKHPVGLLIIDYLQLLQTIGRQENRTQQIAEISRGIKLAAREFNLPVVVLAQFNRGPAVEKREPQLHDLRESGSIEQDSDKVIFLHVKNKPAHDAPLEVSMIVAKQRNGKSRKYIDLVFVERYARFEECAKGVDEAQMAFTGSAA